MKEMQPRRLVMLAAAVIVVSLAASLAVAQTAAHGAGGQRVSGSGVRSATYPGGPTINFSFDATTTNNAVGVNGSFNITINEATNPTWMSGVVTCLVVNGNTATIGGVVTRGQGWDGDYTEASHDLTGDWFITTVQDNGNAKKGSASPDLMSYIDQGNRTYFTNGASGNGGSTTYPTFQSLCDNPSADIGGPAFGLSSGDIKIGT